MVDRQQSASDTQHLATPQKSVKQTAFIVEFAKHGNITRACVAAAIDRSTLYRWKEKDTRFLIRYNHAFEMAKDAVRAEIHRRAIEGVQEPVYQLGKHCGEITKYSDTLLIFHAKMLMPEYREKQQVEVSGPDGGPIQHQYLSGLTEEELDLLEQMALKARSLHGS